MFIKINEICPIVCDATVRNDFEREMSHVSVFVDCKKHGCAFY